MVTDCTPLPTVEDFNSSLILWSSVVVGVHQTYSLSCRTQRWILIYSLGHRCTVKPLINVRKADNLWTADRSLASDWFDHRTNTFRTSEKQTLLNSEQWTLISSRPIQNGLRKWRVKLHPPTVLCIVWRLVDRFRKIVYLVLTTIEQTELSYTKHTNVELTLSVE